MKVKVKMWNKKIQIKKYKNRNKNEENYFNHFFIG